MSFVKILFLICFLIGLIVILTIHVGYLIHENHKLKAENTKLKNKYLDK